jgi:hypothetical protein
VACLEIIFDYLINAAFLQVNRIYIIIVIVIPFSSSYSVIKTVVEAIIISPDSTLAHHLVAFHSI